MPESPLHASYFIVFYVEKDRRRSLSVPRTKLVPRLVLTNRELLYLRGFKFFIHLASAGD